MFIACFKQRCFCVPQGALIDGVSLKYEQVIDVEGCIKRNAEISRTCIVHTQYGNHFQKICNLLFNTSTKRTIIWNFPWNFREIVCYARSLMLRRVEFTTLQVSKIVSIVISVIRINFLGEWQIGKETGLRNACLVKDLTPYGWKIDSLSIDYFENCDWKSKFVSKSDHRQISKGIISGIVKYPRNLFVKILRNLLL